jgi:NodT family efflux transporter outer membrane factor (OMF) lipoprotein
MKIHNIKYITAALLITVLASCKVGQNYRRPDLKMPEQYTGAAAADSSMANIPWNRFFEDAALQALIGKAINENFDLQVAIKRTEVARLYLKQARLGMLPSLNLQATASSTTPSRNSLNGLSLQNFLGTDHIEDYTVSAGLSWEADIWGKIRRQKEAARATYLQSDEAAKAVKTALVADVAEGYFNLLMLDEQLAVAKRNLSLSDSIVYMIQMQKTAGEVTELAVQQAIVQQQSAAQLVPELEQSIAVQEHALSLLLGDMPGHIDRSGTLEDVRMAESFGTGVPANLLSNRPDVRAGELALVAANARAGVAQAQMYPSLSITASGGVNAFKADAWFNLPGSLFGIVAGSLVQPVFQQRRLRTQWEVAKNEREQAVLLFRQTVVNAVREVSDALVSKDKLAAQYTLVNSQANTLKQAVVNAQLLFKSGMANYLEVISVQRNALQTELTLVQVKRRQLAAGVALYRSLGGGWK